MDINYAEFKKKIPAFKQFNFLESFIENRKDIRIKKEKLVLKNLEKIFAATLKIGNSKGFNAMSIRDLSEETGLSMGALYAYFSSKDNLLVMLQRNGRNTFTKILQDSVDKKANPVENLRTLVKTHLFMSEAMQPWFFFTFSEVKNLNKTEQKIAMEFELNNDQVIADILRKGKEEGVFIEHDHNIFAAIIKAMMSDWYLKRWKYSKMNMSVDNFAVYLLEVVESFCLVRAENASQSSDPN